MKQLTFIFIIIIALNSCSTKEPQPIKLNSDSCDFCKMTISDYQFAAELISKKGRVYKFDDVFCMLKYINSEKTIEFAGIYVNNYLEENKFIETKEVFFLKGGSIKGPMGGDVIGFSTKKEADLYKSKLEAISVSWEDVLKSN